MDGRKFCRFATADISQYDAAAQFPLHLDSRNKVKILKSQNCVIFRASVIFERRLAVLADLFASFQRLTAVIGVRL